MIKITPKRLQVYKIKNTINYKIIIKISTNYSNTLLGSKAF